MKELTIITQASVHLLAMTDGIILPPKYRMELEADCDSLSEFAGRLCYLSFGEGEIDGHKTVVGRTNNDKYLEHIKKVGHGSVLEHPSFSVLIEGVSRSLTHELVRHRHFSFSQLSQRYVDESQVAFVRPPELEPGSLAYELWYRTCLNASESYEALLHEMTNRIMSEEGVTKMTTEHKKRARQTARSILPNCTETKIVVSGNARTWRHFLSLRATRAADTEIRRLAIRVFNTLMPHAPNIFGDFMFEGASIEEVLSSTYGNNGSF